ncbi:MAG: hypothetical protein AAF519_16550 [Bacteroidota bacterium]
MNEAEITSKIKDINQHKKAEIFRLRAIIDVEVKRNQTEVNQQQLDKITWIFITQESSLARIDSTKSYQELESAFEQWRSQFEDTFKINIGEVQSYSGLPLKLAKEFMRYDIYVTGLTQMNKELMLIN